ncbi:MAG TPA: DegT/DnrJ/EryC1/StrS family aminotransferase [Spirochaetota bacterium]|nr:DegT/DnrJ/EryC1/StrS family aminotransferase [Spirochaetota bacterium]
MKIPFHKAELGNEEINAASEVIKSGWLTMGEKTFEFEREFCKYTGVSNSIAVNSCTAALHLALKAADIKSGDEVIIPAITFIATWEVITYFGAVPVLCDVLKDSFLIDPSDIEKKITPKTKAVIPVHYGGESCDMDSIMEIARKHNLLVIEDAAHAFPTLYKGRMVGTIGDITCFSFYATKTLTTGEGGMVTTENSDWAERMRRLRLHGITKDAWNRYSEKGSWEYDVSEAGYKYNITDIASAIGVEQLKKCDEMNLARRKIAFKYNSAFSKSSLLDLWKVRDEAECAWHLYPVKLRLAALKIDRNEFIVELKNRGIGTSVHYIPMYRFTVFKDSGYTEKDFPGCEDIFPREVSLPIFPGMTDAETDYVIENVLEVLDRNRR